MNNFGARSSRFARIGAEENPCRSPVVPGDLDPIQLRELMR